MAAAAAGDRKLRIEGGGNLLRAAERCGVRRYMQQSSGFFLTSPQTLADESATLAIDASPGVAASARTYAALEARTLNSSVEGVLLRYGFFYGPNTWYHPDGGAAEMVRRQQQPLIGDGQGVWSFVHIEDAALATVAALTAAPGIYNVVDSDPSPVSRWLPAFATSLGASAPLRISEQEALAAAGEDAVYYQTKLQGATNRKAMEVLTFRPRPLEWLANQGVSTN
jgi:nucleoside-diphosphate-sugar epimerase